MNPAIYWLYYIYGIDAFIKIIHKNNLIHIYFDDVGGLWKITIDQHNKGFVLRPSAVNLDLAWLYIMLIDGRPIDRDGDHITFEYGLHEYTVSVAGGIRFLRYQ